MKKPIIGIIAGAGPYAGLDLAAKILEQTNARSDQGYLPVYSVSTPSKIEDRTRFLLGESDENPAYALARNFLELQAMKATLIGLPCNTAHAATILDVFHAEIAPHITSARYLDMIQETVKFIGSECPGVKKLGILSTLGTWKAGFYPELLEVEGYHTLVLDEQQQRQIHEESLFHPEHGIKVQAHPVSETARNILLEGVETLQKMSAEAIILGCTEIPLGIQERKIGDTFIIDPGLILARALIREASPEKLLPWNW
tara:strand:+ start:8237 stop:9007 length:771 start_codon:yes stop_codon:yes gene_type:complete